jgi:histidine ammonia-lyase
MVNIGQQILTLKDYYDILFNNEKIEIPVEAIDRVINSYNFLLGFCGDKVIYGINTGLGPMAQYSINKEDRIQLQYNAIRSHCCGLGERIPDTFIKAAMICSLNSYLKGHSGIHYEVVELLKELINRSIYPVVPEHGGVGASGDLIQLAHIALILIGEGNVSYNGMILPAIKVFGEIGLQPISIHIREGLSLINGTYMMTGIGTVNLILAKNLVNWAIAASTMINEIVNSYDDYFSSELNNVKLHNGQQKIAEKIREIISDSKLIRNRKDSLFNTKAEGHYIQDKVQEYYSLRCIPQILGPIYDTIEHAEKIVLGEANSCSDNPIIDIESRNIYHGGNFHGDYVSFEMDKLKIVITKLSMLLERQINFLLNDKLNNKLPPFVNLGKLGVNFGMQGTQFTATSTVAENQTLSFPMYIHSISNNNDNQDIVSMGTNAALLAKKVINNSYEVIAIELMVIIQAVNYLGISESLSSVTKNIYNNLRSIVPVFKGDSVKYNDINNIKEYVISSKL